MKYEMPFGGSVEIASSRKLVNSIKKKLVYSVITEQKLNCTNTSLKGMYVGLEKK